jgi:hypothetical protein
MGDCGQIQAVRRCLELKRAHIISPAIRGNAVSRGPRFIWYQPEVTAAYCSVFAPFYVAVEEKQIAAVEMDIGQMFLVECKSVPVAKKSPWS